MSVIGARQRAATRALQPALHELTMCLHAPTLAASGPGGQIDPECAQGVFHGDVRVLSQASVSVNGFTPEPISRSSRGADGFVFTSLLRALGDEQPDPTVRLDRVRRVSPGRFGETLELSSTASQPVPVTVEVEVAADFAQMHVVKGGRSGPLVAPIVEAADEVVWRDGDVSSRLSFVGPTGARLDRRGDRAVWTWEAVLESRGCVEFGWELRVTDGASTVQAAPPGPSWATPVVQADDRRLGAWVKASLTDLESLRMVTVDRPDDVFAAAGAPWYFTLFGRDSLWAARMMLPLGTDLAAGSLRTLAARQGTAHDGPSQQQPGKILHELRRSAIVLDDEGTELPPDYYGTVDATPLWLCVLHDAWRWGMADADVRALLPAARAALNWLLDWADPDDDGLLEYVDTEGTGLTNQGWKDSGDSVRFRDGSLAEGPIALAEVQGYAYEALVHGSDLLEAFGEPGTDAYRQRAKELRASFARGFWVTRPDASYLALALDASKNRVDAVASNMCHLPGTGLLEPEQEATIARWASDPTMDSGFGLRTMSSASGGYAPLSYHCGSVWPHDTAIALLALARAGLAEHGRGLVDGLLDAAAAFEYRLPELWSGDAAAEMGSPVPYPAACRPQAWSVTSAVAVVQTVLGLEIDVVAGTASLRPMRPSPVGRLRVEGLVVAGEPATVEIDAAGEVVVAEGGGLVWSVH